MRYFNRTRGPVAVTLSSGQSCVFPPKMWVDIPKDADGSEGLADYVHKGVLVRNTLDIAQALPSPAALPIVKIQLQEPVAKVAELKSPVAPAAAKTSK